MNEEQIRQLLAEIRTIRISIVVIAAVFVLSFLVQLLNIHI
ncbi:MAG: hypothetical protein ABIH23_03945 [bacterium]